MTIFVLNVGSPTYGQYSLPLLQKLAAFNKANLCIINTDVKQNTSGVHPSWIKCFCHELVNDDFILCWDLDLVPARPFLIEPYLDKTKINAAVDSSIIRTGAKYNHKFRWNCGLLGIPKSYNHLFIDIYSQSIQARYPSYEQYYVNDRIFDDVIKVNELPQELNYFYQNPVPEAVLSVHYTWKVEEKDRLRLIKEHFDTFGDNFNG